MREIKFRTWNEKRKTLNYTDTDVFALSVCKKVGDIIMQFTGKFDKNGKEIYEGDIITYNKYTKESGKNEQSKPKVVFWDNEKAGFETAEKGNYSSGMFYSEYTIIGNIYENPELLSEQTSEDNPCGKPHNNGEDEKSCIECQAILKGI